MNHELLLKTEVPASQALSARSQSISESSKDVDTVRSQAFSSELGKQIDKQVSPRQSETPVDKTAVVSNTDQTNNKIKAEQLVDKNGNPLPSEQALTAELTQQLLSDFEGDPATKQELTQIIEQFVDDFINHETADIDLKDSLTTLLNQLINAGLAASPNAKSQNTAELTVSESNDPPKVMASVVATASQVSLAVGDKTALAQSQATLAKGETQYNASQQAKAGEQKVERTQNNIVQVERGTSVIQQLKDAVTTEILGSGKDNGDKAQGIAELVKQILATKSATTNSRDSVTLASTTENAAPSKVDVALRADILQALTGKSTPSTNALSSTNNDGGKILTNPTSQGDMKLVSEKQGERVLQLVDLLKPAKSDEQFTRTMLLDKAAPGIPLITSPMSPMTAINTAVRVDQPTLDIQPSLQSKAWNAVLSNRVVWMAREGIQQAALRLNPANLGPVEVRLSMHHDQANVTFIAHNAATRDALEQALPRLRESFLENGLELADANVSDHASQQANDDEMSHDNDTGQRGDGTIVVDEKTHENAEAAVTHVGQDIELGLSVYA